MRGNRGSKRLFSERFRIVFAEAVVCEASFDSAYLFFVPEAKKTHVLIRERVREVCELGVLEFAGFWLRSTTS
jgi:hypothetical protein